MAEHAVIAYLKVSNDRMGSRADVDAFHELSHRLAQAIEEHRAGEFDGDEFGDGLCTLFMYGPNADKLFAAVEPALRASPLSQGGRVVKRYGPATDKQAKQVSILL